MENKLKLSGLFLIKKIIKPTKILPFSLFKEGEIISIDIALLGSHLNSGKSYSVNVMIHHNDETYVVQGGKINTVFENHIKLEQIYDKLFKNRLA